MVEFLKNYGIWIFLVLMLGMHLLPVLRRGGGGCCGGGHQHGQDGPEKEKQAGGKQSSGCH